MYIVTFSKQAAKDVKKLKAAGLDAKAKSLIDIIRDDPYRKPPNYEALVGSFKGLYSRRINIKHRLVYQISEAAVEQGGKTFEGTVNVLRMWSHYEALR